MSEKMLGSSHDTDNDTLYALTCNIIRDFCEDAIASGRLPSDREINAVAYSYVIDRDESKDDTKPLLIKPSEASRLSGLSTRTITRMCIAGELPAVRLRGSWMINRVKFMNLLEGGR